MYDIDSLFTIQLEENADGNKLIEHLGKYFEEFPQNIELDRFFSYDKPTGLPDNPTVADLLKSYVGKVEKAIKDERASTDKTPGKLEDLDNLYKNLLDVVATSYKNIYVKTIIDVVRAPRNLEDGVTPIGFARFKDIVTDRDQPPSAFQLLAYLDGKSEDEYASEQQVKAFTDSANNFFLPTTQLSLYESTSRGAALTGIFANSAKALAMILYK